MKKKNVKRRKSKGSPNRKRYSSKKRRPVENKKIRLAKDLLLAVTLSLIIMLAIMMYYFQVVSMTGASMSPTLNEHDKVIVSKKASWQRFDLLAIKGHGKPTQIRRLIGSPGEKILYRDDLLYVNDVVVDEKFLVNEINLSQSTGKNYTENLSSLLLNKDGVISDDFYLVLGDNRPYATDSRHYGLVPKKDIIGKVLVRYWPFSELTPF